MLNIKSLDTVNFFQNTIENNTTYNEMETFALLDVLATKIEIQKKIYASYHLENFTPTSSELISDCYLIDIVKAYFFYAKKLTDYKFLNVGIKLLEMCKNVESLEKSRLIQVKNDLLNGIIF